MKGEDKWKRKALLIAVLCLIAAGPVRAQQSVFDNLSFENLTFEKSVVMIRIVQQELNYRTPWKSSPMVQGIGSGFIIDGNRIMTNAHNISNAKYIEVKKQNQAQRWIAQVEYVGHDCDLAILTLEDSAFFNDTVPLDFGGLPNINSTVQTYGFPVGGRHISVTEGVVSRIQVDTYSHSRADMHLVIQTDAAINPGNSGGPVIQSGKVVGVAFQGLRTADNIGYMIPTTVIHHFLNDIQDGEYDGFGSFGFTYSTNVHNPFFMEYSQLPPGQEGIVVTDTRLNSNLQGVVQAGDIITKIDDFNIDNDGLVYIYGMKLHVSEAIEGRQIGDAANITFYRDGQIHEIATHISLNRPVIPYWREYDRAPRYVVYGGLAFVPVSRNLLEMWGNNWITDLPFNLRYLFFNSDQLNENPDRKEYIVLSEILPDEVNQYVNDYVNEVVTEINGREILSLDEVYTALLSGEAQKFVRMRFFGVHLPLVMDNDQVMSRHDTILKKYNVPVDHALEK